MGITIAILPDQQKNKLVNIKELASFNNSIPLLKLNHEKIKRNNFLLKYLIELYLFAFPDFLIILTNQLRYTIFIHPIPPLHARHGPNLTKF